MQIKPRSLRRHHYQRLKKNRSGYLGGSLSDVAAGRLVSTATLCSCFMCGNPRRYFNQLTMQERRLMQISLLDYDENEGKVVSVDSQR